MAPEIIWEHQEVTIVGNLTLDIVYTAWFSPVHRHPSRQMSTSGLIDTIVSLTNVYNVQVT